MSNFQCVSRSFPCGSSVLYLAIFWASTLEWVQSAFGVQWWPIGLSVQFVFRFVIFVADGQSMRSTILNSMTKMHDLSINKIDFILAGIVEGD